MNLAWPQARLPDVASPAETVAAGLAIWGARARGRVEDILEEVSPLPLLADMLVDYPRRGGKMMRPALCLAAAEAFSGDGAPALGLAAAVELFHAALLIHDDIEDESEFRRGRPALHCIHGVPLALHAGDATLLVAWRALATALRQLPPAAARRAVEQTDRMAGETMEGQALELEWRSRPDLALSEADYLAMVMKKTAWMSVVWPLQLGALAGGAGPADLEALRRLGLLMGSAFQIRDDLLNLTAEGAYGKERLGDLYEAKRTLMLLHVGRRALAAEARWLTEYLALQRSQRTPAMAEALYAMMLRHGSLDDARAIAEALAGAALHEFARLEPRLRAGRARIFLAAVIPWACRRA